MRDLDTLTPLDARNSLLLDRKVSHQDSDTFSLAKTNLDTKETSYQPLVHHAAPPGHLEDDRATPSPYNGGAYAPPPPATTSGRGGYDQRINHGDVGQQQQQYYNNGHNGGHNGGYNNGYGYQ